MQKAALIVEDEWLVAMDIKGMMEVLGWRIIGPATSVEVAMTLIEHEEPAVALLDMSLINELVTPVAEALKARGVPFLVASAYLEIEAIGGEVFAGVTNIGKPVDEWRLKSALSKLPAK